MRARFLGGPMNGKQLDVAPEVAGMGFRQPRAPAPTLLNFSQAQDPAQWVTPAPYDSYVFLDLNSGGMAVFMYEGKRPK